MPSVGSLYFAYHENYPSVAPGGQNSPKFGYVVLQIGGMKGDDNLMVHWLKLNQLCCTNDSNVKLASFKTNLFLLNLFSNKQLSFKIINPKQLSQKTIPITFKQLISANPTSFVPHLVCATQMDRLTDRGLVLHRISRYSQIRYV